MILLQDETDSIAETDSDRDRGTRGVEMETGSGDIRDTGAMNLTSGGSRPNSRPTSGHTDPADHDVSIILPLSCQRDKECTDWSF